MKKLLLAIALASLPLCAPAAPRLAAKNAPVSPAERADILKLINMTGAMHIGMRLGATISNQLISSLKRMHPGISDRAIRDIEQACSDLVSRSSTQSKLVNALVKIYAGHYSDADIRGMIRFYETPLGKKIIKTTPAVVHQSMLAGEATFRPLQGELIDLIRQYLRRDHIDPRTLKADKSG